MAMLPVVPQEEPLASLLHVRLAMAAEDLGDLGLDLAQRHLQPRLPAVAQPVDELVIPCSVRYEIKRIICTAQLRLKVNSFNFMDQFKKVADLGKILR